MPKEICGYCGCEIDDDHARGYLAHPGHDALRLADECERSSGAWDRRMLFDWAEEAAACLRRQHAEIARLTAERDKAMAANRSLLDKVDALIDECDIWQSRFTFDDRVRRASASAKDIERLTAERDAAQEELRLCEQDAIALQDERNALREALTFYAEKNHFMLSDESAWDTVSGEPQNLWCDEAGTAIVEDGAIARAALAQKE